MLVSVLCIPLLYYFLYFRGYSPVFCCIFGLNPHVVKFNQPDDCSGESAETLVNVAGTPSKKHTLKTQPEKTTKCHR